MGAGHCIGALTGCLACSLVCVWRSNENVYGNLNVVMASGLVYMP